MSSNDINPATLEIHDRRLKLNTNAVYYVAAHGEYITRNASLDGLYTQGFNRRHGCGGLILRGRLQSILMEKESYLLEPARDAIMNPVRAKKV